MGDHYEQNQGIQGKNVNAHNNTFTQTNNNAPALNVDYAKLAAELKLLIVELDKTGVTDEQIDSTAEVRKAVAAAEKKEAPKLLGHLKKAGKWVLDTAVKIGVPIAVEVLKQGLGM